RSALGSRPITCDSPGPSVIVWAPLWQLTRSSSGSLCQLSSSDWSASGGGGRVSDIDRHHTGWRANLHRSADLPPLPPQNQPFQRQSHMATCWAPAKRTSSPSRPAKIGRDSQVHVFALAAAGAGGFTCESTDQVVSVSTLSSSRRG